MSASLDDALLERGAMQGQNIICFAKEWNQDPTSCDHVMRELARNNRVLWLNSIATRAPKLQGRDLRKVLNRLRAVFSGASQMAENLWLFTPFVLPFHHNRWVARLNSLILRMTLRWLRRRLGMRDYQLWTFVPTSAQYVGGLGSRILVYYCTDDWSSFSFLDGARIRTMVESLSARADVVFATSQPLVEKLKRFNSEVHLASHGVKYQLFAQALEAGTPVPAELSRLPRPRLGYYGLIEEWMDQQLLAYLASRHPEWSIVLIGKVCVDTSALEHLPNVHFLGRKPHSELPGYCKGLDVALIPHKVNDLTRHMNPIKLREYISAGLQIVSTALPEMQKFPAHCIVADGYADFEAGVQAALAADSLEARRRRSISMRGHTWEFKVRELERTVMRVQNGKRQHSRFARDV